MGIKELESPVKSFAKKVQKTVKKATPKVVKKVSKKAGKVLKKVVPKEVVQAANKIIPKEIPSDLRNMAIPALFTGIPEIGINAATAGAVVAGKTALDELMAAMTPPAYEVPSIELPEMPDYSAVFGEIAAAQEQAATALQNFDVPDLPVAPPAPPPIGEAAINIGQSQYNALRRDKYRGANSTIITGSSGLGAGTPGRKTLLGG